jgi:hypothetical protein
VGDDRKSTLQHVLWIGGGTDTGKTSIAQAIADRYDLHVYHYDRNESSHIEWLINAGSAYFQKLVTKNAEGRWELRDVDEYWVLRSPDVMAQETITSWKERFPLVVEDLQAMPKEPMIVAEGPGLFPECVYRVLRSPRQAIWLIPTEPFKRALVEKRGKPGVRAQTRDPRRATENLIARDMLMARLVREEARERGLRLCEVDGSQSLEEMIAVVEHHFEPLLREHGAESPSFGGPIRE